MPQLAVSSAERVLLIPHLFRRKVVSHQCITLPPSRTPSCHGGIHHASVPHRRCPSAAKLLSTAPPPTRPCSAMEPPSTAPHRRPSPAVAAMFCREATFHRAAVPHGIILRSRGGGLHSSAVRRCEAVHVRSTRFRPRTEPNYRLTDLSVSTLL